MADVPNHPPGRPQGNALIWSPEEIAALSQVSPEDRAEARDLWREHAGNLKTLLDAKVDDGNPR